MLIRVAADARSDDQIDYGRHLLPVSLLVLAVLSLHILDELANQCVHLLLEVAGKFLHKFHALATSRLRITLLQVTLDILSRLVFVLLHVLLSHRNVRHDQHLEEHLQVLSDEYLVVWQG